MLTSSEKLELRKSQPKGQTEDEVERQCQNSCGNKGRKPLALADVQDKEEAEKEVAKMDSELLQKQCVDDKGYDYES